MACSIGLVVGSLAGYYGGGVDNVLMRMADVFLSVPNLVLALALISVLKPSLRNVMIALGITGWVSYARVLRAQFLALRGRDFVVAARMVGARSRRVILCHILPNAIGPVVVLATFHMASAILAEAGLSFLGLGVQPPTPSWGSMLTVGKRYLQQAPHIATFPGLAIFVTALSFNLLGDGLRDALDPRTERRQ
jgi:peptide/nickel transport system permease protein